MRKETRTQWVSNSGAELLYIDKTGAVFICCQITKSPGLLMELHEAIEEASNFLLETRTAETAAS